MLTGISVLTLQTDSIVHQ